MDWKNLLWIPLLLAFWEIAKAILANRLDRGIDTWWSMRSLANRRKSREKLRNEYLRIVEERKNFRGIYLRYFRHTIGALAILLLVTTSGVTLAYFDRLDLSYLSRPMISPSSVTTAILDIVFVFVGAGFFFLSLVYVKWLDEVMSNITRHADFPQFEKNTLSRLAELEGKTIEEVKASLVPKQI